MSRPIRKALVAAVITVGTTGGLAGTAFAATSVSTSPTTAPTPTSTANANARLHAIQAKAKVAIDARLRSLNFAIADVNTNPVISKADRQTLLATLNGDVSGLTALETKIQGDTTVAQAQADYETIFTGYRVYALALPQVLFAAATDDITGGALPKLNDANTKLTALLAGPDKSKDTPPVQAAMKDLGDQIKAITVSTNGLSAEVLAFTPAEYDANHAILAGPHLTLKTARADVGAARGDIAFVVSQIKS